ncbi:MAG: hypothetical protein KDD37_06385 [Bdellovibrionales bacterium]|nr:hypothetical protein [Bdellovibrionales bacterium]
MKILIILLFAANAQARVFNFQNEHFAPYFRGSIGLSTLGDSAYGGASGTSTKFSETPDYNYTGEAGFLFTTARIGFTFGVEFLTSSKLSTEGNTSSGTKLMDLDSKVSGTILKGGILWHYKVGTMYRAYIALNGGLADLKMKNNSELTAAGTTAYSLTTVDEVAVAQSVLAEMLFGFEFNLADVTTMIVEGGYRSLKVDKWEYDGSGTNFLGAYTDGGTVLNHDGTKRQSNLSGWLLAIGFRFYIN